MPGFVNLWLKRQSLRDHAIHLAHAGVTGARGQRNGFPPVLLDFGSPNVGKQLHVGHMRSALIGDTLSRILEWQGFHVDRVSHVGDVGLPVALVVASVVQRWTEAGCHSSPREWVASTLTAADLSTM